MNDGTNNTPKRPTPIPTEAQRDGLACIRCGLDFTTSGVPSVPAGTWNSSQMFRCVECAPEPVTAPTSAMWPGEPDSVREAAEINDAIEAATVAAGRLLTRRFGQETGAVGERLVRLVLCDAAGDCRLDPDEVTALFLALREGDLATVEEALTAR